MSRLFNVLSKMVFNTDNIQEQVSNIGDIRRHEPSTAISCANNTYRQLAYITLPAGTWLISANASFAAVNATGFRRAGISTATSGYDNVTTPPPYLANQLFNQLPANNNAQTFLSVSGFPITITSPTTFRFIGWQNSGGAVDVSGRIYGVRIK